MHTVNCVWPDARRLAGELLHFAVRFLLYLYYLYLSDSPPLSMSTYAFMSSSTAHQWRIHG